MASTKPKFRILLIKLLFITNISVVCSGDNTDILSRLYKKSVDNGKPMILVLDSDSLVSNSISSSGKSRQSNEATGLDFVSLLQQLDRSEKRNKNHDRKHRDSNLWIAEDSDTKHHGAHHRDDINRDSISDRHRQSVRDNRIRKDCNWDNNNRNDRDDRDRDDVSSNYWSRDDGHNIHDRDSRLHRERHRNRVHNYNSNKHRLSHKERIRHSRLQQERKERKSVLRSPIVKGLLSLRNRLACGARDQCQDKCGGSKNNRNKCEDACDKKFDCQDEEEERSGCPDGTCEDSGKNDPPPCGKKQSKCTGSTKAEMFEDDEGPSCPKC